MLIITWPPQIALLVGKTVQQKDYIDAKIREQIMIRSGAYTSGTDQ